MKSLLIILIFLSPFYICAQETKASNNIIGIYQTQNGDAKIEIFKKGEKYFGKVIWIKEPLGTNGKPLLDEHNPNITKRKIPILNLVTIRNLSYKNGEWIGGSVYDPKNGKTYECTLWLENGNLKVRGYLGWFYDTKTWKRIK